MTIFVPLIDLREQSQVPLLRLGFRPFYLLAAAWMVLALPVWLTAYGHGLAVGGHLQFVDWHAHEMLFGFTGAVIVGFLFTAVKNWTGQATPVGWSLAGIALLWLSARGLLMTRYSTLGIFFDIGFYLLAAVAIALPVWRAGNFRNSVFVLALLMLAILSALHHLSALNWLPTISAKALLLATLDVILLVITVMAGRVLPSFTANAIADAPIRRNAFVERLLIPLTIALLLCDLVLTNSEHWSWLVALLSAALFGLHVWRFSLWHSWKTRGQPLLWILHCAYLWLLIGFALRTSALWFPLHGLLATHAFTAGLIVSLCLGMMCRTARGHTGRPLRVSRTELTAFILVTIAALIRVLLPLLLPAAYGLLVLWSGLLTMLAFLLFLIVFVPWLCAPRADGRPG